jgi:hypothetical protein
MAVPEATHVRSACNGNEALQGHGIRNVIPRIRTAVLSVTLGPSDGGCNVGILLFDGPVGR